MPCEVTGIVFNIQHLSTHDGPGWRTLVFLKGCPLRCEWCANPESWHKHPQLAFNKNLCLGLAQCAWCLEVCREKSLGPSEQDGLIQIDRQKCSHCGDCASKCPSGALHLFGETVIVKKLLASIEEDSPFYARSGGGLTLGGGEPLIQSDFAAALLSEGKRRGLHTSVETCGAVSWNNIEQVLPFVDHVLYDIKSADPVKHKYFTGISNEVILANLQRLDRTFPEVKVTIRTPVIPGFNDKTQDIAAIITLIQPLSIVTDYELLPYHRFGTTKYEYLGIPYKLKDLKPLSAAHMAELNNLVKTSFSLTFR